MIKLSKIIIVSDSDLDRRYKGYIEKIKKNEDIKAVKRLKIKKLDLIFKNMNFYLSQGFSYNTVLGIFEEKAENLLKADNMRDIEEISKLSTSHFLNDIAVVGRYHIPAEELILLQIASVLHPLNNIARKRYDFLYKMCLNKHKVVV